MRLKDRISLIIQYAQIDPEHIPSLEARLFFEGSRWNPYLVRFSTLLILSTIIAAGGVINDSTAKLIGATIIAPIMIPMLATGAALVMADAARARRSLLTVILGVALVIVVSWLVGIIYIGPISYTGNTQIVSRIHPDLGDLIIALASGAAGAFAISRSDVAAYLPGAAIAVSLVVPLCVVGISLSDLQWESASGAMRLFLTNFLSILLAGGGTFALLGLRSAAATVFGERFRRRSFTGIAVGLVLLSMPLAISAYVLIRNATAEEFAFTTTEEWLSGTEYEVQEVEAIGDQVKIVIIGYGPLPDTSDLADTLEDPVKEESFVSLEIIESEEVKLVLEPADEQEQ